jgi:hypothetical protein
MFGAALAGAAIGLAFIGAFKGAAYVLRHW